MCSKIVALTAYSEIFFQFNILTVDVNDFSLVHDISVTAIFLQSQVDTSTGQ